ncbi:MAG: hypothetical protein JW940_05050 [Polyangiaceae bacterium]|nr:hypothetical protein [Polyangiaceae bacterium]
MSAMELVARGSLLGSMMLLSGCGGAGPRAIAPASSGTTASVAQASAEPRPDVARTALPPKEPAWPPGLDASLPQLPKLGREVAVDGRLTEYESAISIPLQSAYQRVKTNARHEWRGIDDLGAEAWVGWTDRGIAVAVVVSDDDVVNRRDKHDLTKEDAVELFIDGRSGSAFASPKYGPGAYHVIAAAPTQGKPKRVVVAGKHRPGGLEVASERSPGGYTVEALLPWSAFQRLSPGSGTVGLAFQVDEYDRRDGKRGRTVTLANPAVRDLARSPARFEPWRLVERIFPGGSLGSQLSLDGPRLWAEEPPRELVVRVGAALARRARSVRIASPVQHPEVPVQNRTATVMLDRAAWPEGRVSFTTEARDAQDRLLGVGSSAFTNRGPTIRASLESLRTADLLSHPFQGAAWAAAAAALARLREAIAAEDLDWIEPRAREVRARIALLEDRPYELDRQYLHDLLVLGDDPESEVVIEYPAPRVATVTFVYGSIPLGSVRVTPHQGALSAGRMRVETKTVLGYPALVGRQWAHWELMDEGEIDPARQVFVWYPKSNDVYAARPSDVDRFNANCRVALGPGARVSTHLQESSLKQASRRASVLVTGDPRPHREFAHAKYMRVFPRAGPVRVVLAADERRLDARAPSYQAAELMLTAVLAHKPVALATIEELRQSVVRTVAPRAAARPVRFQVGDLHMHTFCSDGQGSPVALMLQALYAGLSFAVLTDHNTLRCALHVQKQLAQYGVSYAAIAGEELTTSYHAVVFPLQEALLPPLDMAEAAKRAHAVGAFIQWNHPTHLGGGMEHYATGLRGLGFDAWEHFPPRYDAWHQQGTLPLMTGTTDTHTGTFGDSLERTLVFSESAGGSELADALRHRRAVAILPLGDGLFYGLPKYVKQVQAALSEGHGLRALRAERLRAALTGAKLEELVLASPTRQSEVP